MRHEVLSEKEAFVVSQLSEENKYWLDKLSDPPEKSHFPYDSKKLEKPGNKTGSLKFEFPGKISSRMISLCSGQGPRLHVLLVAGMLLLLNKYTDNDDIIIGTPIYKQEAAGNFINTALAIRSLVEDNMTFKELLLRVNKTIAESIKNQNYPIESLVRHLNIEYDENEEDFPLFDVTILLENILDKSYIEHIKHNMTVSIQKTGDSIEGVIEYNSLLYTRKTIKKISTHFTNVLDKALFNLDLPVSGINILTPEEKKQLLVDFNDTRTEYPRDKSAHELFEEQAAKRPDSIALVYEDKQLTYKKLNEKANRLARRLRTIGIKQDSIVGLMLERSIEMIIAVLGILKAGGAYLPIDDETPERRIKYMLDDGNASLFLTNSRILKNYSFIDLQGLKTFGTKLHLTGARKQVTDLENTIPIPDRSLINYERYGDNIGLALAKNTIAILASRGCPYKCAYCHKIWPKKHVFRSAEHILDEVQLYYNMGVRRFVIVDDIFNLNKENSARFFKLLIKNKLKVHIFFPNGLRGDILTRDYINLMVEAGTIHMALALETASPRVQKLIGKNLNIDKFYESMAYLCDKHPEVILELFTMHGFPTETEREAQMTMDFIKSLKWIHLPMVNILKIYPGTDMADLAIKSGIAPETIAGSENLGYHELPETLPFDKNFTLKYQADFLEYLLSKERLLHILPYQMKTLTLSEVLLKYNSFLPAEINELEDLLKLAGISSEELGPVNFLAEDSMKVPGLDKKMKQHFTAPGKDNNALKILLLDVSTLFSGEEDMLYDVNEPPLGLMYLLTYLNKIYGSKIAGKIIKSRADFDSYTELKTILEEFKPDLIGMRTLTFFNQFFHKTLTMIRNWGFDVPVIAGGPYATSDYKRILQDRNVDLVVLGEGEITLGELVGKLLENNRKMPGEEVIREIPGIAFVPGKERLTSQYGRAIMMVDELLEKEPGDDLENINQPDNLAYTMYTSGSTGQPKAVLVDHRNIVRLVKNTSFINFEEEDKLLQTAPLEFDASTFEIWGPLLNGSSLYLTAKSQVLTPDKLKETVAKYGISTMWMSSPLFNQMSDIDTEIFRGVKNLAVGGDALSPAHINKVRKQFPQLNVINGYGPTENTTFSLTHLIGTDYQTNVPIGKPIANSTAFILNKNKRLLPPGVTGELYVGGDGVSRGYINDPELTMGKFISNPFVENGRLYKTGDLARWLPDGNMEFLGRSDNQVKVRGYRIELGEIESQLLEYDKIKEAVVVVRETRDGDKQICAYVVSDSDFTKSELRDFLMDYLPEFMVPVHFVRLDTIPLNSRGKVDRKLLLDPEVDAKADYIAPRDEIEERLATIWSEILEVKPEVVGINSDFFDLGGHSLKSTILVSRMHKEFNVKVPLSEIFTSPTIKELAGYIKDTMEDKFAAIEAVEKREYYASSSAQRRLFVLQQMVSSLTVYNIPVVLTLEGHLDRTRFEEIIRQLIKRHEGLRTSFRVIDEEPVQEIHNEVDFEIEYFEAEENKIHDIVSGFIRVFELDKAPLLRAGMIRVAEQKHILILDMHHIITDGTSMGVFVKEFMVLYEGAKLDELNIQYKDFSRWWNRQESLGELDKQEEYWLKQFAGEIPVLSLPTDYPRPAVQSFKGSHVKLAMDREETRALKTLATKADVTLFMALLALFNIVLSRLSGNEDIVLGSPIAGRRHADLENVIGMFVNTLALRNFPAGDKPVNDFLAEVKERTLEAFENQDYLFENLVEKVTVNRDTARNPIFDVAFAFQNVDIPEIELPGLNLSQYEYDYGVAKFDLTLNVTEAGDTMLFVCEYCTELFKTETIKRCMIYLKKLVSLVLSDPGVRIGDLEIISEAEKKQVLFDFNDTKSAYPRDKTIHQYFEEQVELTPDSKALVLEDNTLTYKVLNETSNRLAAVLREKGVSAGSVVALMVERSMEMIVGMIAILKAGGAYLSIAPDYPENRVLSILEDSGVSLLLTSETCIKPLDYLSLRNIRSGLVKGVLTPPRVPVKDCDSLPIPDRTLVDYTKYHHCIGNAPVKNAITILTTRGCPYKCMFCHKIWPNQHVVRSAGNVFREMRYSYDAGVRRFVFLDDIFNLDMKNSRKFLEEIVKNNLDVQLFFPNGLRGDILTKDYIDLLVEAGTVNFSVALETASPRLQRMIRKNLKIEKFRENLDYITKTYPHIILEMELMFGFPSETEEEALSTYEFLKNLEWIHFPNLNVLKIYPNTDMSKIALEHGIPEESIERSSNMAFHELPETLPFSRTFAREYQSRFLSEYFFSKKRLLHVLPYQMQTLSEDELVKKYDSYLPAAIKSLADILKMAGIDEEELGDAAFLGADAVAVPDYPGKIKKYFPAREKAQDALRVLFLDLSQLFTPDAAEMLYDVVEAPLGLMYLQTYIDRELGHQVKGKIAKSRIDFDSFDELKAMLDDFQPQVIGVRTLSYYNEFFHKTISLLKYWHPDIPVISGGPYSTADHQAILSDINVDVIVLGEGELTFTQLLREIIKNHGELPPDDVLEEIPGITFLPRQHKPVPGKYATGREVLLLDRVWDTINSRDTGVINNLEPSSRATDLAYVLYTSGSTGIPKGVAMEHRPLFNLLYWQSQQEMYTKSASTLQFTPYTFDVSFQEIFSTLCSGGKLVLIPEELRRDMLALLDFLKEKSIERLFLPFVALQHLAGLAESDEQFPIHLREVITAGERLKITPSVARFFKRLKHCVLHNQYGPTESHVVTAFTLTGDVDTWPTFPPIGYPISNGSIYLLDRYRKPVPVGIAGELFIGGDSLARGYLNRESLTAEKFIDNPYSPGERLYGTGDLSRWMPGGNIEFLGRLDHQAKIRGFRVEPGEIENHLLNHSNIKNAVVALKSKSTDSGDEDEKYLAAYIVADREFKTDELRDYAAEQLPEYMVPAFFMQLDKFPLTPTGKIDTKVLPEPGGVERGEEYQAPGDEIEETLTRIWSEVLGIKAYLISVKANFFELGGHSLKATFLAAKIHKELNAKISLAEIFTMPTIKELAEFLKCYAKDRFKPIEKAEKKEFYALSSAQQRLFVLHQMEENETGYNLPSAVVLEGALDNRQLERTFKELIARHESLRTSFETIAGAPVQKIHKRVDFEIDYCDRAADGPDREQAAADYVYGFIQPFDLARAPLMRVGLLPMGQKKHLMVVDMHHIIADGISMTILIKEFTLLYTNREPSPLKFQHKDYSEWQNSEQEQESIKRQEAYWLKEFSDEIPLIDLPTDYPRPRVQGFEGSDFGFEMGREGSDALKQVASENGVTLFMLFLAVYNVFLSKISRQEDIVVGTPTAGRRHSDLDHIMGMFVNTLCLRNRPVGEKTFGDFLKEVKTRTLEAFDNQDYQYENLVDRVMVTRDTGRNPIFDVAFTTQDVDVQLEDLPHLKLTPYEYENQTAKFDLSLDVVVDQHIFLSFSYSTILFKRTTIERFANYFKKLLSAVVPGIDQNIAEIEIVPDQEKKQLLIDFNSEEMEHPRDRKIHELFEEQVERNPDRIAISWQGIQLTYKGLNRQANRLKSVLVARGVKPGSIVGLMIPPSDEMIVGVLGILKAGGAYLPIDPKYPRKRFLLMLEDSGASVLVTDKKSSRDFSSIPALSVPSGHVKLEVTAPRPQIRDIENLPIPDRSLVDYERYHQFNGWVTVKNTVLIQGSRGCPFKCAFCHKIWPDKLVTRSAEHLFNEVRLYYDIGIRRFVLIDDMFNLDIANSKRFFNLIIDNGLQLQLFFPNGFRADLLTKEFIDLAVRAGMVQMVLALETASPRLQKLIQKDLNLKKMREILDYITGKYPQVIIEMDTLHGIPTETEEEAMMTLDFVNNTEWLDFPYVHVLKIYPETDMAKIALQNGISREDIEKSVTLAYHELPATLPFSNNFTVGYQTKFLNEYFLKKERLLSVLPKQMRHYTEKELLHKYKSYLPAELNSFSQFLSFVDIEKDELTEHDFREENFAYVPGFNSKVSKCFPRKTYSNESLRVLLLDLSQFFDSVVNSRYDDIEAPLGLMYILTYLDEKFKEKVHGKIVKSRVDFSDYEQLKSILDDFKPDVIGVRALSYHKFFLHETVAAIRDWGIDVPIIAGGPYATSGYETLLEDYNIDLTVLGEGEVTFSEIIEKIIENDKKLPDEDSLKKISGIAFAKEKEKSAQQQPWSNTVLLENIFETPSPDVVDTAANRNSSDDLAYVIYTSGTTGKPKGVLVEHGSVVSYIHSFYEAFHITPKDTMIQQASFTFDVFVEEVFPLLLRGGKIAIPGKNEVLDPYLLAEFIARQHITIISCSPMLLNNLNLLEDLEAIRSIHTFISGGDVLKKEYIQRLQQKGEVCNTYGPTEATVIVTCSKCSETTGLNLPVGKPTVNDKVYILDRYMKLVPVGIPGELYAAGAGVTRGYLNNPELTHRKFPANPFEPGSRMYRTGDLARWLPDGNIEFLGRLDLQVKIRGFRIELEEIESQLLNHPDIKEAVVLTNGLEDEDKQLCAYYAADRDLTTSQLENYLSNHLPGYMVPTYFVQIERIPMTAHDKVDRKALPRPGIVPGSEYAAPRNDIEEKLVQLWSDVLGVEKDIISIHDDFFKLGGHSLKATSLFSKIRKEFNVNIPLVELFNTPTIKSLSAYIKSAEIETAAAKDNNLVLLKPGLSGTRHLFLIHDGTGDVESYIELCSHLDDEFNYWGIRSDRLENLSPQNRTIEELVRSYIETIKNVQAHGPYFFAGWSLGGTIAFEISRQLEQTNEKIDFLALIDSPPPQKAIAKKVVEFNLQSELKYVKPYLTGSEIEKKLKNVTELSQLWSLVEDYLESIHFDTGLIKKAINRYGMQALPNYHQLNKKESIYYLNLGRTFDNAQASYIPAGKIDAPAFFFKAGKSKFNKNTWKKYFEKKPTFHTIDGNHFSILRVPKVFEFAPIFNQALSDSTAAPTNRQI